MVVQREFAAELWRAQAGAGAGLVFARVPADVSAEVRDAEGVDVGDVVRIGIETVS
jgi:hypothetical protein